MLIRKLVASATRPTRRNQRWYFGVGLIGLMLLMVWMGLRFVFSSGVIVDERHHLELSGELVDLLANKHDVLGIDISQYQRHIDWQRVRDERIAGKPIQFVFIKATEGITRQDPLFSQHWTKAHASGFICGAYHFFYATRDPMQQAKNFERQVNLQAGDLPPVLDIELSNHQPDSIVRQTMRIWLTEITRHYGVKPIIYTNLAFYRKYLKGYFDAYPLWIAQHHADRIAVDIPNWLCWQISDEVHIAGIPGFTDLNIFHGDSNDLRKICLP